MSLDPIHVGLVCFPARRSEGYTRQSVFLNEQVQPDSSGYNSVLLFKGDDYKSGEEDIQIFSPLFPQFAFAAPYANSNRVTAEIARSEALTFRTIDSVSELFNEKSRDPIEWREQATQGDMDHI